ncbi:MAG: phage tail tape measure protein [Phycisphaeraceae bacterium]|nr:phage tail tape measure protein [Phycisphaeraceae bacterium]
MSPGIANSRNIRAGAAYIELTTQDSKLVRGLDQAQKRVKAFGKSVGEIGKRLTAVSAVAAVPLLSGLKIYADFQQQMATVATMLSDSDAEKYMDSFTKGIRKMAVSFGESTEALSGGLYDILSASIAPAKALDVLGVAAKSAKAGLTDTQTAADAITTVLNSYGLAAEQAGDVSDWLFGIVQRGKTTFAELAPQIGMVASTAASAGLPLDELGAMIATLTRNGLRTTTAIDSVNGIIRSFLKPGDEAAKVARELGFEMSTATLQSEGLRGVFERISQLPPDALAKLFPDSSALRGVIPALKNFRGFGEDMEAMAKRSGATQSAYEKMTKTLTFAFSRMKQAGLVALSVIGEAIAEPVSKAAAAVTRYAQMVTDLIQKNRGLVTVAAKVIAIVALVGGAMVAVGVAGQALAFVFGGIVSIMSGVGTVIGIIGSALAALLSPIGLVIAGAVILAGVILHATGAAAQALQWLADQFQGLKDRALVAYQGIADALAAGDIALAAKVLWLALKVEWQRGINYLESLWIGFKETFMSIAVDAFYGAVKALAAAWHGLRAVWVETTSFLYKVWTQFTSGLQSTFRKAQLKVEEGLHHIAGMLDENYDVDQAIQIARTNEQADQRNIQLQKQQALNENEQQRQTDLAKIGTEYESEKQAIDQAAKKAHDERRSRYQQQIDESMAALEEARKQYRAALDEAAQKRRDSEQGKSSSEQPDLFEELKNRLAGLGDLLNGIGQRTVEVRGTFNAAAIQSLMTSDGTADRTAKATEETARNTKRLLTEAQRSGLTFA